MPSLKGGSAFGLTKWSFKNLDDFIGAMEMVVEDVDIKIVGKKKATCNAQPVTFWPGEKECTYLCPAGVLVDPVEFPFCAGLGHEFIDFPPSNDGIADVNKESMHEYLAQKEQLRLWNDDSSVHPQPTCSNSGKLLTKITHSCGCETACLMPLLSVFFQLEKQGIALSKQLWGL